MNRVKGDREKGERGGIKERRGRRKERKKGREKGERKREKGEKGREKGEKGREKGGRGGRREKGTPPCPPPHCHHIAVILRITGIRNGKNHAIPSKNEY